MLYEFHPDACTACEYTPSELGFSEALFRKNRNANLTLVPPSQLAHHKVRIDPTLFMQNRRKTLMSRFNLDTVEETKQCNYVYKYNRVEVTLRDIVVFITMVRVRTYEQTLSMAVHRRNLFRKVSEQNTITHWKTCDRTSSQCRREGSMGSPSAYPMKTHEFFCNVDQ